MTSSKSSSYGLAHVCFKLFFSRIIALFDVNEVFSKSLCAVISYSFSGGLPDDSVGMPILMPCYNPDTVQAI